MENIRKKEGKRRMKEIKQKGVTLIALVITIIVLIVLAGVTINALIGENGIITKATESKNKDEQAEEKEKILLAIASAQVDGLGKLTQNYLQAEIDNQFGNHKAIVIDNADEIFIVSLVDRKKDYIITEDGVYDGIDWNKAMAEAVAPESQDEERNNGVIGIGTDGKPVDMDLWEYTLMEDGTYGLNDINGLDGTGNLGRSAGYIGGYTEDGKILGTIPQYISNDNGKNFIEVTSMVHTFYECKSLIIAPEIPRTVKDMQVTFYQASNLITPPKSIPDSVNNLSYSFASCDKLNKMPKLGKNITDMMAAFRYTSITELNGEIPSNLIELSTAFQGCSKLKYVNVEMHDGIKNMSNTFKDCSELTSINITIPNTVKDMSGTFMNCSSLRSVNMIIPSSVTNLFQTFSICPKLEGRIQIDATLDESIVFTWNGKEYKGYMQTFDSSCQDGNGLIITGSSSYLEKIRNNNPKIVIE